jgi:hypothetical protein
MIFLRRRFRELKLGSGKNGDGKGQNPARLTAPMQDATINPNIAGTRYGLGTSIAGKSIIAENTVPANAIVLSHGL